MRVELKKIFSILIGVAVVLSIPAVIASAHGALDQLFDATDLNGGVAAGIVTPVGQEFTPTSSTVTSVDMYLGGVNQHMGPGQDVVINLRENTIDGAILGSSAPVFVSSPATSSFVPFAFASDVPVTPGNTYVLEVSLPELWVTSMQSAYGAKATYTGGSAVISGTVDPNLDFPFRTYGSGPNAKRDVLTGSGIENHGVKNAPGLDKPFNEQSQAAVNSGKKH